MKKRFNISRDQKIGIATIAGVIIILTLLLNVNDHLGPANTELVQLDEIEFDQIENLSTGFSNSDSQSSNDESKSLVISDFNPNKLSPQGWEDLGFSSKQANSIVKYRENYGPFEKAADVGKIYVISKDKFRELEPYMVFEHKEDNDTSAAIISEVIEINSATKEELESISGIGPVFSERIIKYRSSLGGFFSSNQFQEVYGLKDESLQALIDDVEIDPSTINKININTATKKELKSHPYLKSWELVAKILDKRDKTRIENLNFLVETETISAEEKEKIEPYINY